MKKKIMSIISLVAIVMAIGYNIYSSQKRYVVLSALAQDENPPKLYSAVKGTLSSNGSLKRINDDNGKCIFKLLINVSTAADCKM